jgi:hypothetical protein
MLSSRLANEFGKEHGTHFIEVLIKLVCKIMGFDNDFGETERLKERVYWSPGYRL